jgi:hypothetical protein
VDVGRTRVQRGRNGPVREDDGGAVCVKIEDARVVVDVGMSGRISSIGFSSPSITRAIASSIASGAATQIRTGMPSASRNSSENMTFVGSATAMRTLPSSRKRIGSAR